MSAEARRGNYRIAGPASSR